LQFSDGAGRRRQSAFNLTSILQLRFAMHSAAKCAEGRPAPDKTSEGRGLFRGARKPSGGINAASWSLPARAAAPAVFHDIL